MLANATNANGSDAQRCRRIDCALTRMTINDDPDVSSMRARNLQVKRFHPCAIRSAFGRDLRNRNETPFRCAANVLCGTACVHVCTHARTHDFDTCDGWSPRTHDLISRIYKSEMTSTRVASGWWWRHSISRSSIPFLVCPASSS